MWPFTKRQPALEAERDVKERLDDLEDTTRHLERRFVRLQQQVTRWARDYDEEIDSNGDDDTDEIEEFLEQRRRNAQR